MSRNEAEAIRADYIRRAFEWAHSERQRIERRRDEMTAEAWHWFREGHYMQAKGGSQAPRIEIPAVRPATTKEGE